MSQSNPFLEQLGTIASVKTFINLRKKMIKLSKSSKITLIVLSRNHNQADDDYIIKQWVAWEQFDHYFIQVKFVEDSLKKIWRDMGCLSRPYYFKFFKGCLPHIPQIEMIWSSLPEKCPYSEFFWSVFSPNAGKCGPEKL